MKTIVLAKVEMTGLRETGKFVRRDMNWFKEFEAAPEAKALVWLLKGNESDEIKANTYAATEGYSVLTFPISEKDPIGKAKSIMMKQWNCISAK
jgi:hypothetical protein